MLRHNRTRTVQKCKPLSDKTLLFLPCLSTLPVWLASRFLSPIILKCCKWILRITRTVARLQGITILRHQRLEWSTREVLLHRHFHFPGIQALFFGFISQFKSWKKFSNKKYSVTHNAFLNVACEVTSSPPQNRKWSSIF